MAITLDPAIEQRIQQELAAGEFREPSELLSHALDLLAAERTDIAARRTRLLARLDESCAQADRGEGFSEEELRDRMAQRRANHPLSRPA